MDYPEFKGRTAMITGGASGMGLLSGKKLAEAGANVVLCDVKLVWVELRIKLRNGRLDSRDSDTELVVCWLLSCNSLHPKTGRRKSSCHLIVMLSCEHNKLIANTHDKWQNSNLNKNS